MILLVKNVVPRLMIYVFTGDGKGKTTAAIGMGIRMVGAGEKVLLIRFLKGEGTSSEEEIIQEIKNFDLRSFGRKGFFLPESELEEKPELRKKGVRSLSEEDEKIFKQGMDFAEEAADKGDYKLLILDEIFLGIKFGLLEKEELINFLERHKDLEIVLTGRYCPEDLFELADLVTQMKEIKHPYQEGENAKKGIEY